MKDFNSNKKDYVEVSYYPVDDNIVDNRKKSHIIKKIAKCLTFISCIAIVGAVSIVSYQSNDSTATETTDIVQSSALDINSLTAETVSYINVSESDEEELSPSEIYAKVLPSVVGISATYNVTSNDNMFGQVETTTGISTGTGIIMSSDGYILTNAHVVEDATSMTVILSNEEEYTATLIGIDTSTDIAVLKIQADNLTPAEFGDSDDVVVGDYAYVIGNPLGFELSNSFTSGIISGLNRSITVNDNTMNLIQTSASINAGNSGGSLINSKGQVIGIVSAKMSSNYSDSALIEGLGFAIPITQAKTIIDDLINYGYVTGRPQLGISAEDVTDTISRYYNIPVGVYVRFISEDSAAYEAGLQVGDIIVGVDGTTISTIEELSNIIQEYNAGDMITITYYRNNQELTTSVVLQEQSN